jgi:TonB family protein
VNLKIVSAVVGVLLLAGCAAQQTTISPLLGQAQAPLSDRACSLANQPKRLPAVSQLIDSVGVQRFLGELGDAEGYLVLSIGYDTLGVASSVLPVVASDLEESTVETIVAAVSSRMQQSSPFPALPGPKQARENSWSVLLRIDAEQAQPATMRVGRAEICRPTLLNRTALTTVISREYSALLRRTPSLPDSMQVTMHIYIDTAGVVEKAHADRSSGRIDVDALAHSIALQAQFSPALSNRKPVKVVVSIPFTLRIYQEPQKEEEWPDCLTTAPGRRC